MGMGGVLAASTVIPGKIHYIAYDMGSQNSGVLGTLPSIPFSSLVRSLCYLS